MGGLARNNFAAFSSGEEILHAPAHLRAQEFGNLKVSCPDGGTTFTDPFSTLCRGCECCKLEDANVASVACCACGIYVLGDCHRPLNKRQNQIAGHVGQSSRPVRQKCMLAMGDDVFPAQKPLRGRSYQLRIDALRFLAFGPRFLDNNPPQKLRVFAAVLLAQLAQLWTLGPSGWLRGKLSEADGQMQESCSLPSC